MGFCPKKLNIIFYCEGKHVVDKNTGNKNKLEIEYQGK